MGFPPYTRMFLRDFKGNRNFGIARGISGNGKIDIRIFPKELSNFSKIEKWAKL
jgi:hypothetical protein